MSESFRPLTLQKYKPEGPNKVLFVLEQRVQKTHSSFIYSCKSGGEMTLLKQGSTSA